MKHCVSISLRAVAAASIAAMAGSAFAAPNVDANIELDSTYVSGSQRTSAGTGMEQSGRVELNVSQKAGSDYFVAGRATLAAKKDGTVGTDDMWAQMGSNSASVKLGRFEGADLFPIAQDTVVDHAGTVYATNSLRGRSEKFHAAGLFALGGAANLEIGLIDATDKALGATGVKGVRPVLAFAAGPVTVKLGAEMGKYLSGRNLDGVGFTAGYSAGGMTANFNYAQGKQDLDTNNKLSSFALNGQVGAFAAGFVSAKNDQAGGDVQVQTVHASYSIPLFGVAGASITPAISHSTVDVGGKKEDKDAFRVRVNYAF